MKTALLLVDIQKDYFPGGRMPLEGSEAAGLQAGRLLAHFRQHNLTLVHIQHMAIRPNATFFLPGTTGLEFHPHVQPLDHEMVFVKHYPNSFRATPLLEHLQAQGVERLVIAGMMTHMCIDATTRAAYDYGLACVVVQDACATRQLVHQGVSVPAEHVHRAFLAALDGTYARVVTTDQILAETAAGR